jgi:hypothetical protein
MSAIYALNDTDVKPMKIRIYRRDPRGAPYVCR